MVLVTTNYLRYLSLDSSQHNFHDNSLPEDILSEGVDLFSVIVLVV
jgi:hypothetical protein